LLTFTEDTFVVVSRVIDVMDLNVLFQVAAWSKFLVAHFTFKRFFSWMYSLMPYQIRYLTKSQSTALMFTLEWFLFIMNSFVLLKTRILRKVLITTCTSKRPIGLVSPLMFLQCSLTIVNFFAVLVLTLEKHYIYF
jgi:hypothetical protein